MAVDRVKFQDVVANQLPRFVREDFPLLSDFLEQYYISQENQGGSYDLIQNLDQYVKVDQLCNLTNSTLLKEDLDFVTTTVDTEAEGRSGITTTIASEHTEEDNNILYFTNSGSYTNGFPETNGLIKIDDEIIKYESKTDFGFVNCTRGFSGITSYINPSDPDKLVFETTAVQEHKAGALIYNLNIIFLQEFFKKLKHQVAPGFEDRILHDGVDKRNFIFNVDSFYSSKGTDHSFKILFNSLYGKDCEVIHPSNFLFRPSDADYKVTRDFVVESVQGDPLDLKNLTLFQDSTGARGSVSNVQKVLFDSSVGSGATTVPIIEQKVASQYYQISLDDNSIDERSSLNDFKPNPKTKLLTKTSVGSTILSVDSTIGFPTTGYLAVKDINGDAVSLGYSGKSVNQFFEVDGISELIQLGAEADICLDQYSYAYVGTSTDEEIKVRIVSTLKDFELEDDAYFYNAGDTVKIKSLGIETEINPAVHWFSNIQTEWDVSGISVIDVTEKRYRVNTYDKQFLKRGYKVNLTVNDVIKGEGTVVGIHSIKGCDVRFTSTIDTGLDDVKLNNLLLMGDSSDYPDIEKEVSNVQNSYLNWNDDVLVASNSIPTYANQETNPYDRTVYLNGVVSSTETLRVTQGPADDPRPSKDHGFLTGDAVWYEPEYKISTFYGTSVTQRTVESQLESDDGKLPETVYYVKRVDSAHIKLARSKANLFAGKFITVTGTIKGSSAPLTNNKFIYYNFYKKNFKPQAIYREIASPSTKAGNYTTDPGFIGILNNGVEIINYKSTDVVHHGDITSAAVTRGGNGYDVINPPLLHIEDSVGTGATGICAVTGKLERIDIINSGFDYVNTPSIEIKGGNGSGAVAKANISPIIHSVGFNASSSIGIGSTDQQVNVINNTIGFSTFHKFVSEERVIYDSKGLEGVVGLTTNAFYYVGKVDNTTIKLYNTAADARTGVNTVGLSTYGSGVQYIKAASRKNVVSSIIVTDSGSGYQNKQRTIPSAGINTASNKITIKNHGYLSGEIIQYTAGTPSVSGLSESQNYYVKRIDDNDFSVSLVSSLNTIVSLASTGEGSFNYEPITVEVKGVIGVQTTGTTDAENQNFNCQVVPVFRGYIDSIDITAGGVGYGASEVINFNRQPLITLKSGEKAQLNPIINNGQIVNIDVRSGGSGYNSPPDLIVKGPTGKYAQLTPVISDGVITSVKILNGGVGFTTDKTNIEIKEAGSDVSIDATIKSWRVNNFEKYYMNNSSEGLIEPDDGFLVQNNNSTSLEYGCLYAPRPLRESTYMISANWDEGIYPEVHYGDPDLKTGSGGQEQPPSAANHHSPILGYSYDGNPIYGTYGYSSIEGGNTKQMKSGYELLSFDESEQRPPQTTYPMGFFVEDHIFTGTGDLDEHNGRFCVTPDFPKGVYAYFITLDENITSNTDGGPFVRLKKPLFPYIIGNTFASEPNSFNFKYISNQNDYDIEKEGWFRDTTDYHTQESRSRYKYFFNSNNIRKQSVDITAASVGTVEEVGILTGGSNYQYKDRIVFNNSGTSGSDANAKVDRLSGKEISNISAATTSIEFVEFAAHRNKNEFIGFASSPHNFLNDQSLNINGLSEYFDGFDGTYKVGVASDTFIVNSGIESTGVTGIVTYFGVSGILEYPNLRPNDILGIGTEKVKVLNIDAQQERIRVLREQEGTSGAGGAGTYFQGTIAFEDPRKFTIEVGTVKTTKSLPLNNELYFDPAESVGIGTTNAIGAGTTLVFSNPGTGSTNVFVKLQHIYIPKHGLSLNDPVYYNLNGGTSIVCWNGVAGIGTTTLSEAADVFYVAPLGENFIGIATNKVGIGTTTTLVGTALSVGAPNFVGIGTSTGLLYFNSVGAGDTHSFQTALADVVTSDVDRTVVTVATASTHGLTLNDKIWLTVNPVGVTTVTVKYNDYNRRMVFDPVGFASTGVDLQKNTLTFNNHTFTKGDKVIHTATTPSGGLGDQSLYYVFPYSKDKIRLVTEKIELTAANPSFVDITSQSSGTLSKINPLVELNKYSPLKFDLSDSSLSFQSGVTPTSAFKLDLYKDGKFGEKYFTNGKEVGFAVTTGGSPGIDANAHLTLTIDDNTPSNLWYKFSLNSIDDISAVKKELIIDTDVDSYNQINLTNVDYSGQYNVTPVGVNTFTYILPTVPAVSEYTSATASSSYETNSSSAYGAISKVKVYDTGFGYKSLPGIDSVISGVGTGSILFASSTDIGKIKATKFNANGIGWNYPTDKTLKVVANLPEIVDIESLTSFESIGITSAGINYIGAPDLVAIDGFTKRKIDNIDLRYELGDEEVTILQNTTGMYNLAPRIVPINNSNGIGIVSLSYTEATKTVKIYLNTTFSDASDFHYAVGEGVLIENLSVGVGSTGKGYNSANYPTNITNTQTEYGYTYFTMTAAEGQIGGSGAYIEYSLDGLIPEGLVPGIVDLDNSRGRAVPVRDMPIFNPILTPNNFLKNESAEITPQNAVIVGVNKGEIESWNPAIGQLKVSTDKEVGIGDRIQGDVSRAEGIVRSKINFKSQINTGAGATFISGCQRNTGFLNDSLQRLPNNEYYQNFSYSLQSEVPMGTWDDPVNVLNHTAGFDKYADLQIVGVGTADVDQAEGNIEVVTDIVGEASLHCFYDFDLVTEGSIQIGGKYYSDTINFENKILTDYYQSVGNRVLSIDDVSGDFNSYSTGQKFAGVASWDDNQKYNKIFVLARDITYTDERQFSIVNVLQHNNIGYINEYATQASYNVSDNFDDIEYDQLGTFDYGPTDDGWELEFYPYKYVYNEYEVSSIAFNIIDDSTSTGIHSVGTISTITSSYKAISSGVTTTVAEIPLTMRSSTVLLQLEDSDSNFSGTQINLVHDGTNVYSTEYGSLYTGGDPYIGFGTYNSYISGTNINIDFIPDSSVTSALTSNAAIVGIATTATGIGTSKLSTAIVGTAYKSIPSSGSPTAVGITSYYRVGTGATSAAYYILSIHDTTNDYYETTEVCVLNSASNESWIEFGSVRSDSGIGTVGITSTAAGHIELNFTPNASTAVEIRLLKVDEFLYDGNSFDTKIDLNDATVTSKNGFFYGTQAQLEDTFQLKHNQTPIFRKVFDGSSTTVVNTTNDTVAIGTHFFVTGEKVKYSYSGSNNDLAGSTTNAISIGSTNVSGLGVTTKLPTTLYVIKSGEGYLKFTDTATKALAKDAPNVFDIDAVGIGASHVFTAINQNERALMAVDNMIQSPLSPTKITTTLSTNLIYQQQVPVAGITSFFSGDLLQIGDEVTKVIHVGYAGSSQLTVLRGQMGTTMVQHNVGTAVTKMSGNYNIVDSSVVFASAPHGNIPKSNANATDPDNRDWVGITTSSTFQGRVFMRRNAEDTDVDAYTENTIFDDISNEFTGITTDFALTNNGNNVTGFSTYNGIVLIKGVFQQPLGAQNERSAYTMIENTTGVSSIRFTGGDTVAEGYDANKTNYPIGGVIVSVGSSAGSGYQPLIGAGGSALVATSGTVGSISIGNSGSGYRKGVQTPNVGIQTYSAGIASITNIGTCTVSDGHVTSINITNPQLFYKPRDIVNVGYTSVSGLTTVTTILPHGLSKGDNVQLSGIAFTCNYSGTKTITGVAYSSISGIMTVTTSASHGLGIGTNVIFTGIGMTCDIDSGIKTHYYPRGRDFAYDNALTLTEVTDTNIVFDVGVAGANEQYTHTFVAAATSAVASGGAYTHLFVNADNGSLITGGNYSHTFVSAGVGSITVVGVGTTTATDATYDPSTGDLVLTIVGINTIATTSNSVGIATSSITFTCAMDDYATNHSYPRPTDPAHNTDLPITSITADTITVNVGLAGTIKYKDVTDATYDGNSGDLVLTSANHGLSADTSVKLKDESLRFRCAMDDYNSIHSYPRTLVGYSTATTGTTYDPSTGILTITTTTPHGIRTGDRVKIADSSLIFTCNEDGHSSEHAYPRSSDPISGKWITVTSAGISTFNVDVLQGTSPTNTTAHTFVPGSENINCISRNRDQAYDNAVNIDSVTTDTITLNVGITTLVYFVPTAVTYNGSTGIVSMTIGSHSLEVDDTIKLKTDSLTFTCSKDSGISSHTYPRKPDPYYNGSEITAVTANTLTVNVGTSTVPTFYSSGGTVQACLVTPRRLARDPAINGSEIIRIINNKKFEVNTGVSTRNHLYARGGTVELPMDVVIDDPLSYENIPLEYSSDSSSGVGTFATIDIVVGQGSSVTGFSIDQTGVGYGNSEILTIPVGGLTGIPSDTSYEFREFQLNILETYYDKFNGWVVGELEVLDEIQSQFNGAKKTFGLALNSSIVSIQAKPGSLVEVDMVLLIFINDVLQEPNLAYTFSGGSTITFTTAPKAGDSCKILFYKGSGDVDVIFTDILETVKAGDILDIDHDSARGQSLGLNEKPRVVTGITTMDSVDTVIYPGPGVTPDDTLTRPVNWCKQESDKIVDGQAIGKDRIHYEPLIYPAAFILKSVGVGSTGAYVNDIRPLFDQQNESSILTFQNSVVLQSQDTLTAAAATALVSISGTVSSLDITDGGAGYSSAPVVTIANAAGVGTNAPIGGATTTRATATSTISGGVVSALTVSYGGTATGLAYTTTSVPEVLIAPPTITRETCTVLSTNGYEGDYGTIVGIGTTTSGDYDQLYFDLYIPSNSFMRDATYVGTAITVSGISTSDYLTVFNTDVGMGQTFASLTTTGNSIGIGTTWSDGVYQVENWEFQELTDSSVVGVTTHIAKRIFVNIDNVSGVGTVGIASTASPFVNGDFSWGKINFDSLPKNSYSFYGENGVTGISTSAIVTRTNPLKYLNYT